jgi:hypothetical protein
VRDCEDAGLHVKLSIADEGTPAEAQDLLDRVEGILLDDDGAMLCSSLIAPARLIAEVDQLVMIACTSPPSDDEELDEGQDGDASITLELRSESLRGSVYITDHRPRIVREAGKTVAVLPLDERYQGIIEDLALDMAKAMPAVRDALSQKTTSSGV